jgi:pyruvate dehydrogenase E2 component (dihydrolipoamide acetyltransferase)
MEASMSEESRRFALPDLGEGLTDAEIVQWLVKEGDTVELNQPIVEVETEKALVEIPSPFAGVVESVHGAVGERVNVGATLITIRTGASAPQTGRKEVLVGYGPEEGEGKRRKNRKIGRRAEATDTPPEVPQKALATPPVRKLARELGVDIEAVAGTGPERRVTREDVLAASEAASGRPAIGGTKPTEAPSREGDVPGEQPAQGGREGGEVVRLAPAQRLRAVPEGPDEERIAVRAIRRSIAERMVRSVSTIPHVTEWLQVDATELMRLRADLQSAPEAADVKVSLLPIVVKALTTALRRHPLLNSTWDDKTEEIVVRHRYHVGIATDTERGLLVPVVKNADRLTVFELAAEIARLVATARDGKIGPADLTGSTITVTNIGSFGMEAGTPIINHPECAILALGTIAKRPWIVDDQIVAREVATLSLSFDHRIVDGAEAGRFLRHLGDLIEKPARLFGAL